MGPARRALGCLFGLACGDALGARTEFLSVEAIVSAFPPAGPLDLEGDPARVTDDTQMALAVGEALVAVDGPLSVKTLGRVISCGRTGGRTERERNDTTLWGAG